MDGTPQGQSHFPETRWSIVLRASDVAALDELCRQYWLPLYAVARKKGNSHEQAQDSTQGFFANVLKKNLFAAADPEKGRLRSFLLKCFLNYLSNEYHRNQRRPEVHSISSQFDWDRAVEAGIESSIRTPEEEYDRQWALETLNAAWARLAAEMKSVGKEPLWKALSPYLIDQSHADQPSQKDTAQSLGLAPDAFRAALMRLRRRFALILREIVGDTINHPTISDIDAELAVLKQALLSSSRS